MRLSSELGSVTSKKAFVWSSGFIGMPTPSALISKDKA